MGFDTTPSVVVHRQFAASQQLSANGQTEPTAERIPRLLVPAKTNLPEIVKRLQKKRQRILAEGSLGTDAVTQDAWGKSGNMSKCLAGIRRDANFVNWPMSPTALLAVQSTETIS